MISLSYQTFASLSFEHSQMILDKADHCGATSNDSLNSTAASSTAMLLTTILTEYANYNALTFDTEIRTKIEQQ